MRVCSIAKLDRAAYARFLNAGGWAKRWIVTVDGTAVSGVVLADDEEGVVVAMQRSPDGAYVLNADQTEVEMVQHRGAVAITILPKIDPLDIQ